MTNRKSSLIKESMNLEINEKNILNEKNPKDVYNLVYILFFCHGLIHLLPWTFFNNANDFWMERFRDISRENDPDYLSRLQKDFAPILSAILQLSSIATVSLLMVFGHKVSFTFRYYYTLLLMLIGFVSISIFINIDTDGFQLGFFIIVMVFATIVNGANYVFGVNAYSILSQFPTEFLAAYLNGQGTAAIFGAIIEILALAIGASTNVSAMIYFWIGNGVIAFTFITTFLISKNNKFFIYYMKNYDKNTRQQMITLKQIGNATKTMYPVVITMFFVILTANFIFPSVTSLVNSENKVNGNEWNDVYFTPVISFLLEAVAEVFGRLIATKYRSRLNGTFLMVFSVLRFLVFVPLVMLCNVPSRQHLPLVFPHDYQYILILIAFSITNGYMSSAGAYLIPLIVPPEKLEDAFHINMLLIGLIMGGLCWVGFFSVELI